MASIVCAVPTALLNFPFPVLTGVVFQNLQFSAVNQSGCFLLQGGSDLLLSGVTFSNSQTNQAPPLIASAAIISSLTMQNCLFLNNNLTFVTTQTTLVAAGVNSAPAGAVVLRNVTCIGNSVSSTGAVQGGCLQVQSVDSLTIADSWFENNVILGALEFSSGAAVAVLNSNSANIMRSVFVGNKASDDAGAVLFDGVNAVTIDMCLFENNTASPATLARGGAVFLKSGSSPVYTISNSTFRSNFAIQGGALAVEFQAPIVNVSFIDCYFLSNKVGVVPTNLGGALLTLDGVFVDVKNSFFCNNSGTVAPNNFVSDVAFEGNGIVGDVSVQAGSSFVCDGGTAFSPAGQFILEGSVFACTPASGHVKSCSVIVTSTPADQLLLRRRSAPTVTTVVSSPLVVSSSSTISGNLDISSAAGSVIIAAGSTLTVLGTVAIGNGIILTIANVTSSGTYPAISSGQGISGSFQNVSATLAPGVCGSVVSATPQTSGTVISVTVSVSSAGCGSGSSSGGLSTGALIGIIVGSVCGGILVAVAVILLSRYLTRRRTNMDRTRIAMKELYD